MPAITESIKAEVPIKYADKEWTKYLFSSLYRGYASSAGDPNQVSQKIDADSCTVTFVDESDETVNVAVTVECQVPAETERVREQLRRDLEQFREFLLRHCAQDGCRPG